MGGPEQKIPSSHKLMHVAFIYSEGRKTLYLKKKEEYHYGWWEIDAHGKEIETDIVASHVEEALRLGRQKWKTKGFRTLNCGFRYTLPERDEHGINALFHQMATSYSASNGIYFDEELGHNCIVHNASLEARSLWESLKAK
jgi:hypothetical protein